MFTPGPSHVPLEIRLASVAKQDHHRSLDFVRLHERVEEGVRRLFRTSGRILVFAASGTGAMQAVVENTVSPGDRALVVSGGKYGDRWAGLCRTYHADVHHHRVDAGDDIDPAAVRVLAERLRPDHLFLTHCETSTGTLYDVRALADVGRSVGATVVVDSMTSVGVDPFDMDGWGIDFALTASHKSLMSPPGAAFVAVSEQAWDRVRKTSGYSYWDLRGLRESPIPNTAPVGILRAVGAALDSIEAEGLDSVLDRHRRCVLACRAGLEALGLPLLPRATPSSALTAVRLPNDERARGLAAELFDRFGIRVADGQGELKGRILRVGHIGSPTPLSLLPVAVGLELLLLERGLAATPGAAAAAMTRALMEGRGAAASADGPGLLADAHA